MSITHVRNQITSSSCLRFHEEDKETLKHLRKKPNHTSLNENYVFPCICLTAIWHMHGSCYSSVARHIEPCMSYRSKTYTWNDVILVKRIIVSHSGCYVTWHLCGQLTSKYHIANDTWPDAHYGIAELEKYPEASNCDRMRVIALRYACRRMRIVCYRVEESFNESFPSCDGLTSRRGTFWRHVSPVDPQP